MSQIEISLPETLLCQMEITARKEGISLDQYILFALTRQMMLTPIIRNVSDEDADVLPYGMKKRISKNNEFKKTDTEKSPEQSVFEGQTEQE